MKKLIYFAALFFLLMSFNGCGYQPIYKSQNFNIKIVNHSIEGDQELGRKIYSDLTRTFIGNENSKEVDMLIYAKQSKSIALKDSAGNAVKYKITINSELRVTDVNNDRVLVAHNSSLSETYKVLDRLSKTETLENNIISNLIQRTTQELFLKLLQKDLSQ